MSTITVTRRIKPIRILDSRNVSLLILAALVSMLAALVTLSAAPARQAFDYHAYMLHRRGEWVSPPVSSAVAYQIFRRGEVSSPANPVEAYRLFRLGEWAASTVDLSAYHQSERALVDPNAGLAIYRQSERTMTDPTAGLAAYLLSERSLIPVRFSPYQLSEWFGK